MIFELNYDNQAKEILEGQRRYREQMNSQYTAGYTDAEEKYKAERAAIMQLINQLDEPNADKEAILSKLRELKN